MTLEDGTSVFAKSGVDSVTSSPATWLRREHRAYTSIEADFMPRLLGWDEGGAQPLLLLEELTAATWPPPWTPAHIDAVSHALEALDGPNAPPK